MLVEGNDAVVRDYLEYYGVEESKIDEFCQLSKKVASKRREFMNSLRGLSDEEQDECASSTSLGENEKKLLEELGEALGVTLENCDELSYIINRIICNSLDLI